MSLLDALLGSGSEEKSLHCVSNIDKLSLLIGYFIEIAHISSVNIYNIYRIDKSIKGLCHCALCRKYIIIYLYGMDMKHFFFCSELYELQIKHFVLTPYGTDLVI